MSIKKIALTLFFAIICIGAWKVQGELFTSIAVIFFRIFICVNCITFLILAFRYNQDKKNKVDNDTTDERTIGGDGWW